MRKYKSILILAGILIMLTATYFVVAYLNKSNQNTQDNPTLTPNDMSFTFFTSENVKELEVNNKKTGDDLKFTRNSDDKTWSFVGQADLLVDNAKVDGILSQMSYMTAIKLIEENPKDAGIYGFNEPNILIVKLKDGSVIRVELGNMTPTKDAYYFRSSINDNIYTINLTIGQGLFFAKDDVYDKNIFNFTTEDVQKISYDKEGQNVFSLYYDPKISMHRTLSPMKDFEVTLESFKAFTGQVVALKKDKYVAPASDASKYGFDKPSARFVVESLLQKQTLIFGTEVIKNSQVYGMIEGGKEIFLVDISAMNVKDIDIKNMITPYVAWPSIRALSSLYVKFGDDVADCKLQINEADPTKDKYFVNGSAIASTEAGTNYFKSFYSSVIGIEAVKFEENAKPSGNPAFTIEYTFSADNSKMKFDFIPKDNNYFYILKDGVYVGALADKTSFETLANSFNSMMQQGLG